MNFDGRIWWVMTAIPATSDIDGCVGWMPVFRDERAAHAFAEKDQLKVVAGRVIEGTIS